MGLSFDDEPTVNSKDELTVATSCATERLFSPTAPKGRGPTNKVRATRYRARPSSEVNRPTDCAPEIPRLAALFFATRDIFFALGATMTYQSTKRESRQHVIRAV